MLENFRANVLNSPNLKVSRNVCDVLILLYHILQTSKTFLTFVGSVSDQRLLLYQKLSGFVEVCEGKTSEYFSVRGDNWVISLKSNVYRFQSVLISVVF